VPGEGQAILEEDIGVVAEEGGIERGEHRKEGTPIGGAQIWAMGRGPRPEGGEREESRLPRGENSVSYI